MPGAGDLQLGVSGSPSAGAETSESCSLADAESCSGQSVCEVAEALTVAELQQLLVQLELGPQGRVKGISKGQMLQLLKGGLEKANTSGAEVMSQSVAVCCLELCCASLDYHPTSCHQHPDQPIDTSAMFTAHAHI